MMSAEPPTANGQTKVKARLGYPATGLAAMAALPTVPPTHKALASPQKESAKRMRFFKRAHPYPPRHGFKKVSSMAFFKLKMGLKINRFRP
jgi:hypothetical protein